MLKATISKQKQDKERLLAKAYVTRTKERDAQKLMSSDLAKVILGPRRALKAGTHTARISAHTMNIMNKDPKPYAYAEYCLPAVLRVPLNRSPKCYWSDSTRSHRPLP